MMGQSRNAKQGTEYPDIGKMPLHHLRPGILPTKCRYTASTLLLQAFKRQETEISC